MEQPLALALSLGIEAGVAAGIAPRLERPRVRLALVAAGATLVTHPLAWQAALWSYHHAPVWLSVLWVEAAVTGLEALAYRWAGGLSWRAAGGVSLLANGCSTAVGLLSWLL